MDYQNILIGLSQGIGVVVLLVIFIVVLALIAMAFGPHAAPSQELVCNTVDGVAVCTI